MLIIHRSGPSHRERAVLVSDGGRGRWVFNPALEVQLATGVHLSRFGCILSFADGLTASGHRVLFDDKRSDRSKYVFEHTMQTSGIVLVYFLVGLAWGMDGWSQLKAALHAYIVPDKRLRVMEHTAQHYLTLPPYRFGNVTLQIP